MAALPALAGGLLMGVVVYYLATLMVWLGHYLPHRPHNPLREFHLGGHHRHYPDSQHTRSERFRYGQGRNDSLVPQLPWLFALAALLGFALPAGYAAAAVVEVFAVAALNSYVHSQFHVTRTWLARFDWFLRARLRHDIHHDRDVNFMVADHFWDRRFRVFEESAARP